MASHPPSEAQPDGLEEDQFIEPPSEPYVEDDGGQEPDMTQQIPSIADEEDQTPSDNIQSGTHGTRHSTQHNSNIASDEDPGMLAPSGDSNPATTHSEKEQEYTPTGQFFAKRTRSEEQDLSTDFHFGKNSQQPMNLTGGRERSMNKMMPTPHPTPARPTPHDSKLSSDLQAPTTEANVNVQEDLQASNASIHDTGAHMLPAAPSVEIQSVERKKRKKTKKQKEPTQPTEEGVIHPPDQGMMGETAAPAQAPVDNVQKPATHPDVIELETDSNAPYYPVNQEQQAERDASPHDQLQSDLDAATQQEYSPSRRFGSQAQPILVAGDEHEAQEPFLGQHIQREDRQSEANRPTGSHHIKERSSDRRSSTRVQKQKQSRRTRTANAAPEQSGGRHNWKLADFGALLNFKIDEFEQMRASESAEFASQLESLQGQVQDAFQSRDEIQRQLDGSLTHEHELKATISKQQNTIKLHEEKIRKFKTFVDGLGKDLDSMKRSANWQRRQHEEMVQDIATQDQRTLAAIEEVHERLNDNKSFRNEALKLAAAKDNEISEVREERNRLEEQLSEKIGVLVEERDRCERLQKQIQDLKAPHDELYRAMESNKKDMLDKLYLIHAAVDHEKTNNETAKMIDELRTATQAITTPAKTSEEDMSSVKKLVETLNQRLSDQISTDETTTNDVRTHFDEAVKGLQDQLAEREKLNEDHRAAVTELETQLKDFKLRIENEEAQKASAQAEVKNLNAEMSSLQDKLSSLQSKSAPAENAQLQLHETRAELERKAKALDLAKADLEGKQEELSTLSMANTNLGDQLKSLQDQLQDIKNSNEISAAQEAEVERREQEAAQRACQEMVSRYEKVETQLKKKANNEMKKLAGEKSQLEKQIQPLQEELATYKTRIHQLQEQKTPAVFEPLKQEAERAKKQNQSQKKEIEALQSSLQKLQASVTENKGVKEKLSALTTEYNSEKTKFQEASKQNSDLSKQIEDVRQAIEASERAEDKARSELEILRTAKDNSIDSLQKDLKEAKEEAARSALGLEKFKQSCNEHVNEKEEEANRKVKDLQDSLEKSEVELINARHEAAEFQRTVQKSWNQEQEEHKEELAQRDRKAVDAEAARKEAQTNLQRLQEELQTAINERSSWQEQIEKERKRADAAEEKLNAQPRPSSRSSAATSRIQVPSTKDGITPSSRVNRSMGPPRQVRKKVDRNTMTQEEVAAIPAPEEIRPDSRKTNSANGPSAKGAVVEETQDDSDPFAQHQSATMSFGRTRSDVSTYSTDEMLRSSHSLSQQLPHTVPETQLEDGLPSFAAFNSSSQPQLLARSSRNDNGLGQHGFRAGAETGQDTVDDFDIYEDPPERQASLHPLMPENGQKQLRSISLTEAEKKKYTYQPPVPQPNSGSKRSRPSEEDSARTKRQKSDSQLSATTEQRRYTTPSNDVGRGLGSSQSRSSTPEFMKKDFSASGKRTTTYQAPAGSATKRRTSQLSSSYINDPRLQARNAHASTKNAESSVTEGYEYKRSKRVSKAVKEYGKGERGEGSQAQPSIRDLTPAVPSSSQSRMRTFAGATAHNPKQGKVSKGDEMKSFFTAKGR